MICLILYFEVYLQEIDQLLSLLNVIIIITYPLSRPSLRNYDSLDACCESKFNSEKQKRRRIKRKKKGEREEIIIIQNHHFCLLSRSKKKVTRNITVRKKLKFYEPFNHA